MDTEEQLEAQDAELLIAALEKDIARMARRKACAEALSGVPDPAEFVRRVRALLEEHAGSCLSGLWDKECLEILAMLPPKS